MLYTKKFVFTVSLCAMLAANPVLADEVQNPADLGTAHDVYVEGSVDGMVESGIAGVKYVNRMVNIAGGAAQNAEKHAASAGGSAYNAATSAANAQTAADNAAKDAAAAAASAKAANEALENKLNKSQGTDNKNKAMVTNDAGSVYAGYINVGMVDSKDKSGKVNAYKGLAIVADGTGGVHWGEVSTTGIANGAVTNNKIATGAVTPDKIGNPSESSGALVWSATGEAEWGNIQPGWIDTNGYVSGVLVTNASGVATWGNIEPGWINASGYVSGALITNTSGVATWGGIEPGWINTTGYVSGVLVTNASGVATWGKVTPDKISASGYSGWNSGFLVFNDDGDLSTFTGWANAVIGFNSSGHLHSYIGSGIFGAVHMSEPGFTLNPEVFGSTGVTDYSGNHVLTFGSGGMQWGNVSPKAIRAAIPGVMTFDGAGSGNALSGDNGQVLISTDSGVPTWGKIGPVNTEGVVGMVPVGSADSNTYGQLWIE